jgi:PUA domain protein
VDDSVTGHSQVKSSVQRSIRTKIADQYPMLSKNIDKLIPKKEPMVVAKWFVAGT